MTEDPSAALEYIRGAYDAELDWHRDYEEKVLRYQTIAGTVLGAGAFGLSQVQFALGAVIGTRAGLAFVLFGGASLAAALWGIVASLLAMKATELPRPPLGLSTVQAIAAGDQEPILELAAKYSAAAEKIRSLSKNRGTVLTHAWWAALVAIAAGALALLAAVFVPWPEPS